MVKSVSEELKDRKRRKFERELTNELSTWGNKKLDTVLKNSFSATELMPTADELVSMISSSKFGGKSFLLQAPILFHHAITEFNNTWKGKAKAEAVDWDVRVNCTSGWLGTSLNCFYVEKSLSNFLTKLDQTSFEQVTEISPYLLLDSETHAYGMLAYVADEANIHGSEMNGVFDWLNIGHWDIDYMPWETGDYPEWRPSLSYTTGPLEYVSIMICIVATTEELIERLPEREQHKVSEHTRNLRSGKKTKVKAHSKRTPIRTPIRKTGLTDHIVYTVKDHNGHLRYIGEGKSDRFKHVNSGASHNWKINEHFFKYGSMDIEIIAEGLTKFESLAIEKLLLQNHSDQNLWNIRDYEPFIKHGKKLELLVKPPASDA